MNFSEIYEKADAAGKAAAAAKVPNPMVVSDPGANKHWYVADGVCGFAWVQFAGNTPWAKWAKAKGIARKGYPKGMQIWISDYNQSMQLKEAYAQAFAAVLNENGVSAYAASRMD